MLIMNMINSNGPAVLAYGTPRILMQGVKYIVFIFAFMYLLL